PTQQCRVETVQHGSNRPSSKRSARPRGPVRCRSRTPRWRNSVKLTGERPMEGATPDSLLALHDAGYREVIARLGTGTVLDVGCGVGDETVRLTGPGRRVIGVDYDPPTAVAAQARLGRSEPDEGLTFAAMDGARVGLRDGSVDYVCSSHIIEH